jgi:hypothetical protein
MNLGRPKHKDPSTSQWSDIEEGRAGPESGLGDYERAEKSSGVQGTRQKARGAVWAEWVLWKSGAAGHGTEPMALTICEPTGDADVCPGALWLNQGYSQQPLLVDKDEPGLSVGLLCPY